MGIFFLGIIAVSSEKCNMCWATYLRYYTEGLLVLEVPPVSQKQK